jgi:hypothetical protein
MSVEDFPAYFIPDKSGFALYVHPHLLDSHLFQDEDRAEAESGELQEDAWWRSYILRCNERYEEQAVLEAEGNQDDVSDAEGELTSVGDVSYVAIPHLGSYHPGDVFEIDCGEYAEDVSAEDQGSIHAATRAVVDNMRADVQEMDSEPHPRAGNAACWPRPE